VERLTSPISKALRPVAPSLAASILVNVATRPDGLAHAVHGSPKTRTVVVRVHVKRSCANSAIEMSLCAYPLLTHSIFELGWLT
jgi:hypothetical protein